MYALGTAVWSVQGGSVMLCDMALNFFYGLRLVRTRIWFKLCVQIHNLAYLSEFYFINKIDSVYYSIFLWLMSD